MLPPQHATPPISIPQALVSSSTAHQGSNELAQTETRTSLLETAAFSPVNEHGCFEFDRIVKAGGLLKRGRRTESYKPVHLVLRPLSVSIYADPEHTRLRHSIDLSDITAVARKRQTKRPNAALFTIFTPPRNFHFDARSEEEADQWVYQIRSAAKVDDWESWLGTSDDEGETNTGNVSTQTGRKVSTSSRVPHQGAFGASVGSFSSISSAGAANFPGSSVSLSISAAIEGAARSEALRSVSAAAVEVHQERVLRNGKLYLLKSKGGVKKWKPVWAVLRPKSLAIYPNEQEYAPILIVQFPSIVNAVEIDSPSRSRKRQFCMQIITEERSWRFCALDEDDLTRWLGALKSLLAKRRVAEDAPAVQ